MPGPLRIAVLDGDQTGQELLDAALRVLTPEVVGFDLDWTLADYERLPFVLDRHRRYVDGTFWEREGGPYTVATLWDE